MRRREFIARLGAAGAYAAVPRLARGQQDTRVRRLAILVAGDENQTNTANFAMFRDELVRLGWVEGRNLQIDMRYDRGDVDRMRANAAELVGLAPDVIFANGNNARIVQRTDANNSDRPRLRGRRVCHRLGKKPGASRGQYHRHH